MDLQIALCDRVILVCSETSLNDAEWVSFEEERAFKHEDRSALRPGERKVFPVILDDALEHWIHPKQPQLWQVLAADFRRAAKGKAFEKAVDKLVRGLKP